MSGFLFMQPADRIFARILTMLPEWLLSERAVDE